MNICIQYIAADFNTLFAQTKEIIVLTYQGPLYQRFQMGLGTFRKFLEDRLASRNPAELGQTSKMPYITQRKQHYTAQWEDDLKALFALHSLTKYSLQHDVGCCCGSYFPSFNTME